MSILQRAVVNFHADHASTVEMSRIFAAATIAAAILGSHAVYPAVLGNSSADHRDSVSQSGLQSVLGP